jgi:hypothetical protein
MFYVIAITPALVTLLLLAVWALKVGKHNWVFGFAVLGCLISAASPWFSIWYAWNVLNDHTANIGAGLLAIGQPLIAPVGAVLGALFGIVVEAAVRRHGGR